MTEKKKILLIDDDRDLVMATRAFLEGRGYNVVVAHNGVEGMEMVQSQSPDLIVLDIMMDYDAEGFNLAYKLKEDDTTRNIPIIIMSGFPKEMDQKAHSFEFIMERDWPAAEMLEKPADLNKLAETIGKLLA